MKSIKKVKSVSLKDHEKIASMYEKEIHALRQERRIWVERAEATKHQLDFAMNVTKTLLHNSGSHERVGNMVVGIVKELIPIIAPQYEVYPETNAKKQDY